MFLFIIITLLNCMPLLLVLHIKTISFTIAWFLLHNFGGLLWEPLHWTAHKGAYMEREYSDLCIHIYNWPFNSEGETRRSGKSAHSTPCSSLSPPAHMINHTLQSIIHTCSRRRRRSKRQLESDSDKERSMWRDNGDKGISLTFERYKCFCFFWYLQF